MGQSNQSGTTTTSSNNDGTTIDTITTTSSVENNSNQPTRTRTHTPTFTFTGSDDILNFRVCNKDWETEEAKILTSQNLSCVATERVAIVRHAHTYMRTNTITTKSTTNEKHGRTTIATTTTTTNCTAAAATTSTTINPKSSAGRHHHHRKGDRGDDRLKHPLLVSLLQRVIRTGFYGSNARNTNTGWDCNVYGDRIRVDTNHE